MTQEIERLVAQAVAEAQREFCNPPFYSEEIARAVLQSDALTALIKREGELTALLAEVDVELRGLGQCYALRKRIDNLLNAEDSEEEDDNDVKSDRFMPLDDRNELRRKCRDLKGDCDVLKAANMTLREREGELMEALTGLVRQHGCACIPRECRTPEDERALAALNPNTESE